jgi:hypothetical protein
LTGNRANGHFDLGAATDAAAAEADEKPFAFTFHGADYTVPPMTDWSISALRALAAGDLNGALGELLGEDAYGAMADAGLKVRDLNLLFDKIAADAGMTGLGNSPAPLLPGSART